MEKKYMPGDYKTVEEAMATANGQGRKFAGKTKYVKYTLQRRRKYKELVVDECLLKNI